MSIFLKLFQKIIISDALPNKDETKRQLIVDTIDFFYKIFEEDYSKMQLSDIAMILKSFNFSNSASKPIILKCIKSKLSQIDKLSNLELIQVIDSILENNKVESSIDEESEKILKHYCKIDCQSLLLFYRLENKLKNNLSR